MKELIERLERATGPDRELDYAIFRATSGLTIDADGWVRGDDGKDRGHVRGRSDRYTESIDAALTLVPEGAGLQLERYWLRRPEPAWRAVLYTGGVPGNPRRVEVGEDAFGPAIALCIAALRAREALAHSPAGNADQ